MSPSNIHVSLRGSERNENCRVPCAMTIAGSDSGGGAGVEADLKTFSALGVFGTCVITAITAQNTRGVYEVFPVPPRLVKRQIEVVMDDIRAQSVKTGMLYSSEIMERLYANPSANTGSKQLSTQYSEREQGMLSSAKRTKRH